VCEVSAKLHLSATVCPKLNIKYCFSSTDTKAIHPDMIVQQNELQNISWICIQYSMSLVISQFFCENHKKISSSQKEMKKPLQNFTGGDIKKGNRSYQEIKLKSTVTICTMYNIKL